MYRDRQGRLRQEIRTEAKSGKVVTVTTIIDPVSREVLFLKGDSGELVSRMPFPGKDWPSTLAGAAGVTAVTPEAAERGVVVEDLGMREIDGIACQGRRVKSSQGETETWSIAEWPVQAISIHSVSGSEEYSFRLFDIRRKDPDPSLFSAPPQ